MLIHPGYFGGGESEGRLKARTIKGVGRWYAWHGSGMNRKMEGYKRGW